jgi:DnaJ family protein C protein 7
MSASEREPQQPEANGESATSPAPSSPLNGSVPGAFPQTNGTAKNGSPEKREDAAPRPPPHRTPTSPPPTKNPTSPPPVVPIDAEAFKANGNKFFKAKDYKNAIREYTKGILPINLIDGLRLVNTNN